MRQTYSSSKCGPRCYNSTSPDCSCSCGGRNHGRGPLMSPVLPGMVGVIEARAEAAAVALGEALTVQLVAPLNINRASGLIERDSPLFFGKGSQPSLFDVPPLVALLDSTPLDALDEVNL